MVLRNNLDFDTGKPKHSGHTIDDVANSLLDDMWKILKGKAELDNIEDNYKEDDDEFYDADDGMPNKENVPRKEGWMFQGYITLMFYGPFAGNLERQLDFFVIGDPKPGKEYGQIAHRKKLAEQNDKQRKICQEKTTSDAKSSVSMKPVSPVQVAGLVTTQY